MLFILTKHNMQIFEVIGETTLKQQLNVEKGDVGILGYLSALG